MTRPKILIVDDDRKFLHFITEGLTGAGYDVRGVEDPLSTVAMAEEFLPNLVILDVSMPGKGGLELAKELHANPTTKRGICVDAQPLSIEGQAMLLPSGSLCNFDVVDQNALRLRQALDVEDEPVRGIPFGTGPFQHETHPCVG